MKKCDIGGQGVLEGVMMRAPEKSALAVRKESGEIATKEWKNKIRQGKFVKLPIVRGCVNLVDMLFMGVGVISDAATMYDETLEQEEPSKFEKFLAKKTGKSEMSIVMGVAVVLAIALSVGLFFLLPSFLVSLVDPYMESKLLVSLIEGGIRIAILIGYMLFCTAVKEVKRVFMYHGAEHKTIACYENGLELNVENVKKQCRLHPRCGTSYLLLVMIVAILIYACLSAVIGINETLWIRVLSRIVLLPLIAGVAYEVLKLAAKYENWFTRALRWPGMQLQRLTTKEPDAGMMEVAIVAFEMALAEKSSEEIEALIAQFDRSEKRTQPEGAPHAVAEEEDKKAHTPGPVADNAFCEGDAPAEEA